MNILNKNQIVKTYRNFCLRKNTPPVLRTIYVDKKGNLSELVNMHGQENVDKQRYLSRIRNNGNDTWEITRDGKDDIKDFYKKQSPFKVLSSVIFGLMSKFY